MHDMPKTGEQAQQGFAILSALICSVTRTVHLLSRWPGSCGMWHFGVFFVIGFVIQLIYYQMNVEASGRFDAIDDRVLIFGSLGLLALHNLAGCFYWNKGERIHSWSPGVGILYRLMPKSDPVFVAILSDVVVAAALAAICYLFGCPILGSWYLSMIFWCLVNHALLSARHHFQMQRLQDAQIEQQYWADEVENQRVWAQIQRERWGDRYE